MRKPQPSRCSHCDHPVLWRIVDDVLDPGHRLPVVPMGRVYVTVSSGTVEVAEAYLRHTCDPAAVQAKEQRQRERQQYRETQRNDPFSREERLVERARLKEEIYQIAMTQPCPKCQAEVGQRCTNLAQHSPNYGQPTSWAHAHRVLTEQPITNAMLDEPIEAL